MPIFDIKSQSLQVSRQAKRLGLTQQLISEAIGVSQSQVSRILSGQAVRRSRVFIQICEYVNTTASKTPRTAIAQNQELMDALACTWDGTPGHAAALAAVIRSLNVLGPGHQKP